MVGVYLKGKDWLSASFGLAITKDIDKKKIIISRDCEFFVIVDLILSLENDWNHLVVY